MPRRSRCTVSPWLPPAVSVGWNVFGNEGMLGAALTWPSKGQAMAGVAYFLRIRLLTQPAPIPQAMTPLSAPRSSTSASRAAPRSTPRSASTPGTNTTRTIGSAAAPTEAAFVHWPVEINAHYVLMYYDGCRLRWVVEEGRRDAIGDEVQGLSKGAWPIAVDLIHPARHRRRLDSRGPCGVTPSKGMASLSSPPSAPPGPSVAFCTFGEETMANLIDGFHSPSGPNMHPHRRHTLPTHAPPSHQTQTASGTASRPLPAERPAAAWPARPGWRRGRSPPDPWLAGPGLEQPGRRPWPPTCEAMRALVN